MAIGGTTLYIHGSRIAVVPFCRQVDTIFSVFESVEIFSVGVSDATLGKAIVTSMGKSREDVGSKSECLDLDDFAKLFGERSIGGFEKRSGMVGINFSDGQLIACTWHRNGRRGWRAGTELYLPVDTDAEELARICRQELNGSLSHSLSEASLFAQADQSIASRLIWPLSSSVRGSRMTRLDKIFVALGSVLACAPSVMAVVVMPQFRQTFQSFGADLPWLTKMLSDYPASLLLFPALVLLVAFAWPNEKQRGLFSLLIGVLFMLLGPVIIVVGAYLPVWKLGAAI